MNKLHITYATQDQPKPQHGPASRRVLHTVITQLDTPHQALYDALLARERKSMNEYATPLQTFNDRNALAELWQEDLDAIMYAGQLYAETPTPVSLALLQVKINSAMATLGLIMQVNAAADLLSLDAAGLPL